LKYPWLRLQQCCTFQGLFPFCHTGLALCCCCLRKIINIEMKVKVVSTQLTQNGTNLVYLYLNIFFLCKLFHVVSYLCT
jgi:hypothetical protein